jgi:hypothetical protein
MLTNVSELLAASIIRTMIEEVGICTAETSVNFFATIRRSIPQGCHVHYRTYNLKNCLSAEAQWGGWTKFPKTSYFEWMLNERCGHPRGRKNDVEEREKRKEGK